MPDAPKRMSPERLEELRSAAVRHADAPSPVARIKLAEQRELIAEIDALRAELTIVTAARDAALADCRILVAQINRLVDDAHSSGLVLQATVGDYAFDALARHGGGA